MFNLPGNIKEDSGKPESGKQEKGKMMESCNQKIMDCTSVLTGISHEMRTQMNAIVAFSFLLNKAGYNEKEREEFSNHIYFSCEQIISLFDNFLDSAVIDTGNSRTEPGICNPDRIFNELLSEFRDILKKEMYKDLLLMTDNLSFNHTEYLLDGNRLARVIRNLFHNSLSNTKSGYIKVGYYFRDNKLTFYVQDSGQGFFKCREFLETQDLTVPLTRFSDTYTAVNLALTRKLIQLMEGSVWIECNGLAGSSIYFSVPAPQAVAGDKIINKFSNTMSTI